MVVLIGYKVIKSYKSMIELLMPQLDSKVCQFQTTESKLPLILINSVQWLIHKSSTLPVTSIQKTACAFPAQFTAVHPYKPAWWKVMWSTVYVLLFLLPRSTPFLVQLICSAVSSPLTMHVRVNVELNATERFLSSGFSSGGAWRARELRSEFAVYL